MILPTKHVPTGQCLLGVGAALLKWLDEPRTVSALWEKARPLEAFGTFERFVLTLDLLYAVGAVELREGLVQVSWRAK